MIKTLVLVTLLFLVSDTQILHSEEFSFDAPNHAHDSNVPFKTADTYEQALHIWKSPEDINAWIAANFSYDMARAIRLSETQRAKNEQFLIYPPFEFFKTRAGVCVDLSRFAVETLRRIDPKSNPNYLMIEFDPIQIAGNTLRFHWLASFKRDGKTYFFADSKRPGHIAGPYNDAQEFINEYAQYRGRKILAFRELGSYQKQRRIPAQKLQSSEKKS